MYTLNWSSVFRPTGLGWRTYGVTWHDGCVKASEATHNSVDKCLVNKLDGPLLSIPWNFPMPSATSHVSHVCLFQELFSWTGQENHFCRYAHEIHAYAFVLPIFIQGPGKHISIFKSSSIHKLENRKYLTHVWSVRPTTAKKNRNKIWP